MKSRFTSGKTKNLKTIILSAVLILLSLSLLNFKSYETTNIQPPTIPAGEKFLIAGMQSYDDLTNYDSLGFNGTHIYDGGEFRFPGNSTRHTPVGRILPDDSLFAPVYTSAIRDTITAMYNNHNQSRFLWTRPKIQWLAAGQSSIYKAFQDNPDLWFYSFNYIAGERYTDSVWNGGKDVLHCSDINLGINAAVVLSRLIANTEQSRIDTTSKPNAACWWGDSECDWFVKPGGKNFYCLLIT